MSLSLILSTLDNKLIQHNTKGKYSNKQTLWFKWIFYCHGDKYTMSIYTIMALGHIYTNNMAQMMGLAFDIFGLVRGPYLKSLNKPIQGYMDIYILGLTLSGKCREAHLVYIYQWWWAYT